MARRLRVAAAVAPAVAASAALVAPAAAHLSLTPQTTAAGADAVLVFDVPNEDDAAGVVRVTIGVPSDFELDDGEAKPTWTQTRTGQAITWSGGRIPEHQFARFAIRGTAPGRAETILFNVLLGSRSGKTLTYRIPLVVQGRVGNDPGARELGKAALFVAVGSGLLALAAGFLALYVWLRPPPP